MSGIPAINPGSVWRQTGAITDCNDLVIVNVYPDAITYRWAHLNGEGEVNAEGVQRFLRYHEPAESRTVEPCPAGVR